MDYLITVTLYDGKFKATCDDRSIINNYDYTKSQELNAREAAKEVLKHFNCYRQLQYVSGNLPNELIFTVRGF